MRFWRIPMVLCLFSWGCKGASTHPLGKVPAPLLACPKIGSCKSLGRRRRRPALSSSISLGSGDRHHGSHDGSDSKRRLPPAQPQGHRWNTAALGLGDRSPCLLWPLWLLQPELQFTSGSLALCKRHPPAQALGDQLLTLNLFEMPVVVSVFLLSWTERGESLQGRHPRAVKKMPRGWARGLHLWAWAAKVGRGCGLACPYCWLALCANMRANGADSLPL